MASRGPRRLPAIPRSRLGATGSLVQVQGTYYAKNWRFDRLTMSGIQCARYELIEGHSYI